ncbi:DNA methyltransferase [candidate division WOR-3 bacterium JGI_Cruoil_03_44_89]|uniref:site-specific DNA-methyltransferase (adenine-specific) n=1 Tax=candidate division WOR-3 bacterium JGI_Cruoil_03_44_89 TaxID=1973748 RepID=A0A235BYV0_UNCW3|nr:MAG: DNA methyltransferase [candidate division WOR-3 bacterium JGI_Cruoil_03_44_89]
MLKSYLKKIFEVANRGDAREESYYSILEGLLMEYIDTVGKKNVRITTLPKKAEAGNPDFRIWDGKQHIVGYIEAKAPTVEDLNRIEYSEQLKRYRRTFPNLILTNFFEFRLYRNGVLMDKVLIGRPYVVHKLKTTPPVEKKPDFLELLEKFFSFSLPKVYNAKTLALELAKRTRFLRDEVVSEELKEEETKGKGFVLGFYEAFRKFLISGLSKEGFADLYSQTITYGLFAARTRTENGFNRKLAYDSIPHTIGILRDVFRFISLEDLPPQMEWIIDDISEVLAVTDAKNILHEYFHEGKGKDPIVHFYETFLAEYDPKTRKGRGVYYTPEPVVSYIVRSLHNILKEHFNRADGFASDMVTVLDPAAGTLTFLADAAKLAVEEFVSKYGEGGKEKFIKEYILKNFYAFELMMAPYAVGHLKMSFLLEELGYKLQKDDRFKLYLTNTLEMEELAQTELPGMASLSEESHLAGKVKKEQPILVILGNPPYHGSSANLSEKEMVIKEGQRYVTHYTIQKDNGYYKLVAQDKKANRGIRIKQKTWIGELIEYYKIIDGQWLKERNPKWLQDDYVKFIRFAQWKINQAGEGVLGFITNHSYLDNPTFRGMRQSLMNTFNEIYVLDLHGNSLKREKCPDGSKDENVFDIQQGVTIGIFIKKQEKKDKPSFSIYRPSPQKKLFVKESIEEETEENAKKHECNVYHSEVWGIRENKNEWLLENDIKKTKWQKLSPKSDFYLFIPRDERLLESYEKYPKITKVFPINSVGIVTSRDTFVIKSDREALKRNIRMFRDEKMPDELVRRTFNLKDKSNWKLSDAREKIQKDKNWDKSITPILYRPFDVKWIFYHDAVIERSRKEVMRHMMQENLGLLTCRQQNKVGFYHTLVCDTIVESCVVSNKTREINYLFPLYLYQEKDGSKKRSIRSTVMLFESQADYKVKMPNLSLALVEQLTKAFKETLSPEQILFYIYAVLYSNTYRTKYAEFLKIDFPRIPFTRDYKIFNKMADYGKRLVDLHLLKSTELDPPIAKFQGEGGDRVEKLRYDEKQKCVYINQAQYFKGITADIWEYQIGGYQVCSKWLKDRKGRSLSLEDIKHYCKIVTSLQKTIVIQKTIDNIYSKVEKETTPDLQIGNDRVVIE